MRFSHIGYFKFILSRINSHPIVQTVYLILFLVSCGSLKFTPIGGKYHCYYFGGNILLELVLISFYVFYEHCKFIFGIFLFLLF